MQHSALNQFISEVARPDDVIVVYGIPKQHMQYGPTYFQFTDPGLPVLILSDYKSSGMALEEVVKLIDREASGHIYLVSREAVRNAIDPSNEFARRMGELRASDRRRFGRNLMLIVFETPSPPIEDSPTPHS